MASGLDLVLERLPIKGMIGGLVLLIFAGGWYFFWSNREKTPYNVTVILYKLFQNVLVPEITKGGYVKGKVKSAKTGAEMEQRGFYIVSENFKVSPEPPMEFIQLNTKGELICNVLKIQKDVYAFLAPGSKILKEALIYKAKIAKDAQGNDITTTTKVTEMVEVEIEGKKIYKPEIKEVKTPVYATEGGITLYENIGRKQIPLIDVTRVILPDGEVVSVDTLVPTITFDQNFMHTMQRLVAEHVYSLRTRVMEFFEKNPLITMVMAGIIMLVVGYLIFRTATTAAESRSIQVIITEKGAEVLRNVTASIAPASIAPPPS